MLLVVVDTLRADHLSAWGYTRETSPTIDALARESLVFRAAIAQAPSTVPSVLQLMTGRYLPGRAIDRERALSEVFAENGYETFAVIDNPILETEETHVDRGFEAFYVNDVLDPQLVYQHWKTKTPADVITRQAIRRLEARDRTRPFFAWLHYFDPHDPYFPPFVQDLPFARENSGSRYSGDVRNTFLVQKRAKPTPFEESDRQHLIDLYDAEIYYLDQSLADLFDYLRREGLYEHTLVVLTSDHGEAFGEHGHWLHGKSLHGPEIRVPLLLKLPGPDARRGVDESPAQLVDVLPTLCALVQLPCPEEVEGRNLLAGERDHAYSLWHDWTAVQGRRFKWMRYGDDAEREFLFDLAADPGEMRNLAAEEPEVLERMRGEAEHFRASLRAEQNVDAESRETVERLRSLGYLE